MRYLERISIACGGSAVEDAWVEPVVPCNFCSRLLLPNHLHPHRQASAHLAGEPSQRPRLARAADERCETFWRKSQLARELAAEEVSFAGLKRSAVLTWRPDIVALPLGAKRSSSSELSDMTTQAPPEREWRSGANPSRFFG